MRGKPLPQTEREWRQLEVALRQEFDRQMVYIEKAHGESSKPGKR